MTIKVGDMVRIIRDTSGSCNIIGDEGVVTEISCADARVQVDGGAESANWSVLEDLELVTPSRSADAMISARKEGQS